MNNKIISCDEYCVYKHTSPSEKIYIGITRQRPEKRWKYGYGYIKKNRETHFANAIKKYGWENFKHEILLENLCEEEAKQKEKEMIIFFDSTNPEKGYNVSPGGGAVSRKTIEKSLKTKKKNGSLEREKIRMKKLWENEEWRRNTVERMQNKPRTEEQKKHYKEGAKFRIGTHLSLETKAKLSKIHSQRTGELSSRKKKVYQINPADGSIVNVFTTAKEASISIEAKPISYIACVCRGQNNKKQFYKGFYWCYEKDYELFVKTIETNPDILPNGQIKKKPEESWMYGKHITSKQKELISEAHRKPVMCLETGIIYKSITEAAEKCGIKCSETISRQINGKQKTVGGLTWKYV